VTGNGQLTGSGVVIYVRTAHHHEQQRQSDHQTSKQWHNKALTVQDRTSTSTITLSGNGQLNIQGAIYARVQRSTSLATARQRGWVADVGKNLLMSGNAQITVQ